MKPSICTIGNLTIDDIILYDTRQMFLESIGGNALYSAIGVRIWDGNPRIIARIGDRFPPSGIDQMKDNGIRSCLINVDCHDIRDWALYEPGGARQFINHLSSGSHYDMSVSGSEIPAGCLEANGFHIAPMPTDVQTTIIDRLTQLDGIISLDPHVEYLQQPHLKQAAYAMLPEVDLFLPSQEEAVALFGSNDLFAAARAFLQYGPEVVAIKMSAEGSLVGIRSTGKIYQIPVFPTQVVDPTGAGDAYCGGFIERYLETGDAVEAACAGTVSSSFVIEYVGALNTFQADFSQAEQRLNYLKQNIRTF